jgi:sigma-B regulation protein RsbU (phosphoserine phosphatase)
VTGREFSDRPSRRFISLRVKIIGAFTLTMMVTAFTVMYFTDRDIGSAMLRFEENSAGNISRFIRLNLAGEYKQILFYKVDTIRQRRRQLKTVSSLTASVFSYYSFRGDHPEPDEKEREDRLRWLRSVPADKEVYWFVFDREAAIVASSQRDLEGKSISSLRDLKGRLFAGGMRSDRLSAGGEYSVFRWDRGDTGAATTVLGHFVPLGGWGWTFCAAIDISDIEAVIEKKVENALELLGHNLAEMKLGERGYSFIFDGRGEILVPPPRGRANGIGKSRNLMTGNPLIEDFTRQAEERGGIMGYAASLGDGEEMKAYVIYFKPLDWYTVLAVPARELNRPARDLVARQSMLITVIFLASLAVAYVFVTRISRPLQTLADYAKKLPSQDLTSPGSQDEEEGLHRLTRRGNDEVKRLADSFIFMKAELWKSVQTLMETTAAKERMESELNVAHDIQMGFLPKTFPPFPDRKEFDLHATLRPAKEVGGDLYDFFFIDEHHLCFTLGDVSDKGVPAALFMGITKTLIKSIAQQGELSAAGIMSLVNKVVGADNPSLMFITLVVAILDTRTGEVNYANGGHNPPILIDRQGETVYRKELSGPVVGAMGDIDYKDLNLKLAPGDAVFLYTDGVTEAMDGRKHLYSDEHLLSETARIGKGEVDDVIEGIMESVAAHVRGAPQSDDIAILMVRYRGPVENDQQEQEQSV